MLEQLAIEALDRKRPILSKALLRVIIATVQSPKGKNA